MPPNLLANVMRSRAKDIVPSLHYFNMRTRVLYGHLSFCVIHSLSFCDRSPKSDRTNANINTTRLDRLRTVSVTYKQMCTCFQGTCVTIILTVLLPHSYMRTSLSAHCRWWQKISLQPPTGQSERVASTVNAQTVPLPARASFETVTSAMVSQTPSVIYE